MTTANKITIARILLIPFFIVQVLYYAEHGREWQRVLALMCFAVGAISDGIDGYIARRYRQRSELGSVLDPLADKLLLVSGVVLLSLDNQPYLDRLPVWLWVTIVSRDLLLLIGMVVIHLVCGAVVVRPHMVGKIATVLQMATVCWVLLKWRSDWLFYLSVAGAVFTGISGLIYIIAGVRQLNASPASAAAGDQTSR
jgi:CDP-diacylglycerol--glycerol-3-phosphate 3-phosphatidyltransferase